MFQEDIDYVHLDVMDGHFVPNLTWGPPVIQALRQHTNGFFDVHLMVDNPEEWVNSMAEAGANQYTFHMEATRDPSALIQKIRARHMHVGIAIKPTTPIAAVTPYLEAIDTVLVMTVEPGFGGQAFMHTMTDKIKNLRRLSPSINIQVDGGITLETIKEVAEAGANMIVAGSSIFKAKDRKKVIQTFRSVLDRFGKNETEK